MYKKFRNGIMLAFFRDVYDPETGVWDQEELGRRWKGWVASFVALAIVVSGAVWVGMKGNAAWVAYRTAEDYEGSGEVDIEVFIPKGATLASIADILQEADVVKTAKAFDRAAAKVPDVDKIQAARYRLRTKVPAKTAVEMLLDPKRIVRKRLTVIEGLRLTEQIPVIAKATGLPEAELKKVLDKGENLGLPDWAKDKPEGFLFPETYELTDSPTPRGVLKVLTGQFNKVATDLEFAKKAEENRKQPLEALTIASIIEAEVNVNKYLPQVSRVIYNRLQKNMRLEMDSTVHYAVGKTGKVTTTDEERATNSPYNTYVVSGLPPGPINSPGKAALKAAIAPADGDWLYFTTVDLDTGETLFANSFQEHQANVAKFQAWCQAHRGRC